jgi:hypothetical protein
LQIIFVSKIPINPHRSPGSAILEPSWLRREENDSHISAVYSSDAIVPAKWISQLIQPRDRTLLRKMNLEP